MLYTIKNSFATHEINRGLHTLYLEEYGNPKGIPILFLHGGPGSGCANWQKELFNSKVYRVVFLDQRGSGKSTPKVKSLFLPVDPNLVSALYQLPNLNPSDEKGIATHKHSAGVRNGNMRVSTDYFFLDKSEKL